MIFYFSAFNKKGGKMNKLRLLPMVIMLVAGLITCIIAVIKNFDTSYALTTLFVVLLGFYVIGLIARAIIVKICFAEKADDSVEEKSEDETSEDETAGEGNKNEEKF